ncbi:MAG: MFS transporter [Gammaproteobacteria bacterium]
MTYWRLSGFYFFYFASLGALIPYWGLYLKSLGYGAVQIGELVAIIMATKIVAPNIWGWIADRSGQHMRIVRITSFLAAVTFAGILLNQQYAWLVFVMLLFSFFWNAALPQFEVTTLNALGDDTHGYSKIRLWGSIGFILTVAALGPVIEQTGAEQLPVTILLLFCGIWLASLLVPEQKTPQQQSASEPIGQLLHKPAVISLLLVCFLLQASHGPYYTFYSLYLTSHGYSESAVGQLWALGVLAEIVVFLRMHRWLPAYGARSLLMIATCLTACRWIMIGLFVDYPLLITLAQLLHAASFGVYHAVAIFLIHRHFNGRHQGKGQALYSSLSFGAGGAIGSFAAGYLWEGIGAEWMFFIAASVALAAMVVSWKYIE